MPTNELNIDKDKTISPDKDVDKGIDLVNDLEDGLITTVERSNIANFIIHEACREYYELYKRTYIPTSFLDFEFEEYKNYYHIANKDIKKFFKLYKEEDIPMIVLNYQKDQYNVIVGSRKKDDEVYYKISPSFNLQINMADESIYGFTDPELYKILNNISQHLKSDNELLSRKELYEQFMMRDFLENKYSPKPIKPAKSKKGSKSKDKDTDTEEEEQEVKPAILSGKTIEVPNQKGKIVKMFFARLNLPTTYPGSKTKSRLYKKVKLSKLMKPDYQIKFITSKKINGVKYSQKYINKRKDAPVNKKKFNFDF